MLQYGSNKYVNYDIIFRKSLVACHIVSGTYDYVKILLLVQKLYEIYKDQEFFLRTKSKTSFKLEERPTTYLAQ